MARERPLSTETRAATYCSEGVRLPWAHPRGGGSWRVVPPGSTRVPLGEGTRRRPVDAFLRQHPAGNIKLWSRSVDDAQSAHAPS
jgi:hypothetical protein